MLLASLILMGRESIRVLPRCCVLVCWVCWYDLSRILRLLLLRVLVVLRSSDSLVSGLLVVVSRLSPASIEHEVVWVSSVRPPPWQRTVCVRLHMRARCTDAQHERVEARVMCLLR